MAEPTFTGVGVALLTFFDDGGAVDVAATAAHARRLAEAGVRAVLVAGTTGEAETLDDPEREELIAATRDAFNLSKVDVKPHVAGVEFSGTHKVLARASVISDCV